MTSAENSEQELVRAFDAVASSAQTVQYALDRFWRLRNRGTRAWRKAEKAYNDAVAQHNACMAFARELARKVARGEPVEDTRIRFVAADTTTPGG